MADPRQLSIQDYTYILPEERIAHFPLEQRDASRLLIYKQGQITDDYYRNIDSNLPDDSLLIFNNTRVIPARLLFQKSTGARVEIFCLEPHEQYRDLTTAMLEKGKVKWLCLIGGASKWKPGQVLEKIIKTDTSEILLEARFLGKRPDLFVIELCWNPGTISFAELLQSAGLIPLPPYLKRKATTSDSERYQTIYAKQDGSVAAPTAGLHFTSRILDSLKEKNIKTAEVTLHVGAGTFKPVKSSTMAGHTMHAEWMDIKKELIEQLLNNEQTIIAVGTTTLRTIESLYWLGKKISPAVEKLPEISQWEPYESEDEITAKEALENLLAWMEKQNVNRIVTRTGLLIAPGYSFRFIKGLVTNFHQPESTLLLLVAALIGNDWKKVYDHALKNDYRFLSYGDGCLLWRND